jgi:hypothetical protein
VTSAPASTQTTHQRAVRFFWALLIAATTVSLVGNVAHAILPYLPRCRWRMRRAPNQNRNGDGQSVGIASSASRWSRRVWCRYRWSSSR